MTVHVGMFILALIHGAPENSAKSYSAYRQTSRFNYDTTQLFTYTRDLKNVAIKVRKLSGYDISLTERGV